MLAKQAFSCEHSEPFMLANQAFLWGRCAHVKGSLRSREKGSQCSREGFAVLT